MQGESAAVRLTREAFQAYAVGGIEALAAYYHPQAEIVAGTYFGLKRRYGGGPAGLRHAFEQVEADFEELEPEAVGFRPGGVDGRVLVEGVVAYKTHGGKGRGAWRSWWVIDVEGAKITRLESFHDEGAALRAAGLA